MKTLLLFSALLLVASSAFSQSFPKLLDDWKSWATWEVTKNDGLPTPYNNQSILLRMWPSAIDFKADSVGGSFAFLVDARLPGLITLPGSANEWPQEVTSNNVPVAVLSHSGLPVIRIEAPMKAEIKGVFRWSKMPQSIRIPSEIGVLKLTLNGQPVDLPVWDKDGQLWLQRTSAEPADKDFLAVQVYRLIEDGSPQWLHTHVELTVAGKSREEALGNVLPEGWKLSSVEAPVPCAVDEAGKLKVQVRAGKWVVKLTAYRTSPAQTIGYAKGAKPLAAEELIGLQNQPGFRLIDITGIIAVDVAQTTFPQEWRQHPVFQWPTTQTFQIEEKMRGMGARKPPGITIKRSFWLDEDGRNLTYQDELNGSGQQTWRLDVATGHKLGAVKIGGAGQLITKNPGTGAEGVEIRDRNLIMQAVGRLERTPKIAATGWQKDAESLAAELNLPPGWRLLAVFGADWSRGDWLTSWSLFDVFMLLIFVLAVWKLWGWKAALVGLAGFLVVYQEPRAPLLSWVVLVAVLAALRFIKNESAQRALSKLRIAALLILAANAVPFMIQQVQQALYPQLEPYRTTWTPDDGVIQSIGDDVPRAAAAPPPTTETGIRERVGDAISSLPGASLARKSSEYGFSKGARMNLKYDTKAKIQTGPAVPQWKWREVSFGWRGPVSAKEQIRLWLIPCNVERLISLTRVVLILGLAWLLLRPRGNTSITKLPTARSAAGTLLCFLIISASAVQAQFPSDAMLKQLRERVLEERGELPQLAEIPHVSLKLQGHRLEMEIEVHALREVAVPLPGKLPSWSPLTVGDNVASLRHEDYLWVLAQTGKQTIKITGLIPPGAEWQWSFLLKPRQVTIDANGWTVTGLKPNGVPEDQVFFVEQNRSASAEAAYDQKDFNPVVSVERELELGLVWQAHTRVKRLSPPGKAISLSLPLLPGERVMSAGMNAENGRMEVRFGAQDAEVKWDSELAPVNELKLDAEKNDSWVERWSLVTSPIWNVKASGLTPVFESQQAQLVPVWTPWPGESVQLTVSRPEAVQGATTTVHQARQVTKLGARQHSTSLMLQVQASLGEDFRISLPGDAEITTLKVRGQELPVRREGDAVIVPVRPGDQALELSWKTPGALSFRAQTDAVKLPVPSSNISTSVQMPEARWLLWANGPMRGPAVRFWGMMFAAILLGTLMAKIKHSPLRGYEWAVLLLGFMQLPLFIGGFVVIWFFALALRGALPFEKLSAWRFDVMQVILVGASGLALLAMLGVVHQGLLGQPEMFVTGNGSTTYDLNWFQDRTVDTSLPQPSVFSVSIWVYRGFMLLWALWMARSVLRWIPWAYQQLLTNGGWRKTDKRPEAPPPLPTT